jgi:4-hydroxyphenylpyruvate dioxygenase-like putative hemolysin
MVWYTSLIQIGICRGERHSEIAEYLGYKDKRSIRKRLNPLLEQGRIAMTVPDKPNSRLQKYITIR